MTATSPPAKAVVVKWGKRLFLITFLPVVVIGGIYGGMVEIFGSYVDMWKDTDSWTIR